MKVSKFVFLSGATKWWLTRSYAIVFQIFTSKMVNVKVLPVLYMNTYGGSICIAPLSVREVSSSRIMPRARAALSTSLLNNENLRIFSSLGSIPRPSEYRVTHSSPHLRRTFIQKTRKLYFYAVLMPGNVLIATTKKDSKLSAVTCVALVPRSWITEDGNKSVKVNFLWSSCSESEGQGGMEVKSDGSYLTWANLRTFEETQSLPPTWFCVHPVLSAENITRMCSPSVRGGTASLNLLTSHHISGFIDLTQTRTRSS